MSKNVPRSVYKTSVVFYAGVNAAYFVRFACSSFIPHSTVILTYYGSMYVCTNVCVCVSVCMKSQMLITLNNAGANIMYSTLVINEDS